MGRRYLDAGPSWSPWVNRTMHWPGPGVGRWWRRAFHKAERRYVRGYGRERSVAHYGGTVNYKTW